MMRKIRSISLLLVASCSVALLASAIQISSAPVYDLWCDVNNDGKVNIIDLLMVAKQFGATGQNLTKASTQYDSGWINIENEWGQSIVVNHNLNIADWSNESIVVEVTGKEWLYSPELRRCLGLRGPLSLGQSWSSVFGGADSDIAYSVVATADGGFAVAGETSSFGGVSRFWLVKTDAQGNVLWNKTYGENATAYCITKTGDGGYALAGTVWSGSYDSHDAWLVKTDDYGNELWNETYGDPSYYNAARSLIETSDGGFALTGLTYNSSRGYDILLVKTNSSGGEEWNVTLDRQGGTDGGRSLVQNEDKGYTVAACTDYDIWLIRTDENGTVLWKWLYGGYSYEDVGQVIRTADGGYAFAAYTYSMGAGNGDFWLVKTDFGGEEEWNRTYGGYHIDYARSLVQTDDGGYALAGETNSFGSGLADLWFIKTDANGTLLWSSMWGGASGDGAWSIVQTSDGEFVMAGHTSSFGGGKEDFLIVKTNSWWTGLSLVDLAPNCVTLYKGKADYEWNYVRVRILIQKQTP
jgi:hypothetical protein